MSANLRDWTRGDDGIVYQRCRGCGAAWYFCRDFCPECGAAGPRTLQASGRGSVHTISLVHRAPSEALRHYAPYLIVLVDAEEGFRMMAQGEKSLAIGDRVMARFARFGESVIPFFEKS